MFTNIKETNVLVGRLSAVKLTKKLIAENKKTFNSIIQQLEKQNVSEKDKTYLQLMSVVEILQRDTKRVDKAMDALLVFSYGESVDLEPEMKEKYLQALVKNLNANTTENSYSNCKIIPM